MAKRKIKSFYCHLGVIISLPGAIIHLQAINVYYWCSSLNGTVYFYRARIWYPTRQKEGLVGLWKVVIIFALNDKMIKKNLRKLMTTSSTE